MTYKRTPNAARTHDPLGLGFPTSGDIGLFAGATTWSANNAARFYRCIGGGTITKIAIHVGIQSGNISVGVYRNSGLGRAAVPSTQLATSGAVACPATGYAEVALVAGVTVRHGDWLALSCDNTTASFRMIAVGAAVASDMSLGRAFRQANAHPLPAPAGTLLNEVNAITAMAGVA